MDQVEFEKLLDQYVKDCTAVENAMHTATGNFHLIMDRLGKSCHDSRGALIEYVFGKQEV